MEAPPLAAGYVRLAILAPEQGELTPAIIARASGLTAEQLGFIAVEGDQAIVDVVASCGQEARERLGQFGAVQLQGDATVRPGFRWLRLGVGRNHGLTPTHLKKILSRAGATVLGRFHIRNTHVVVGIREDHWDQAVDQLANAKVNGVAARPGEPAEHERPRGGAAFIGRRPPR